MGWPFPSLTQRFLRRWKQRDSVRAIAFGLFDNLSLRVQARHTIAEIRGRFEELGFSHLKQMGLMGMSGTKVG
jgi:hypothetical protein